MLKRTPLYGWHVEQEANMTEFAGYKMPLNYKTGIIEEHLAVRSRAGLFDLAHMGQIKVRGRQAGEFLDYVLTQRISDMPDGLVRYSLITAIDGGIIDDIMVYKRNDGYLLVANAANKERDFKWLLEQKGFYDVQIEDLSDNYGIIGLQGPTAENILAPLLADGLGNLKYLRFIETEFFEVPAIVSRTGYTGADGFEIYLPLQAIPSLWNLLLQEGTSFGLIPAGLGSRNTLRLEMGYSLYGHELSTEINPLEAGVGFAVRFDKEDFIGKEALQEIKASEPKRKIMAFKSEKRVIPREGYRIVATERDVGYVTSGTFSPTLNQGIALALVDSNLDPDEEKFYLEVRGRLKELQVATLPFVESCVKR